MEKISKIVSKQSKTIHIMSGGKLKTETYNEIKWWRQEKKVWEKEFLNEI
jgi:hypothetical protein